MTTENPEDSLEKGWDAICKQIDEAMAASIDTLADDLAARALKAPTDEANWVMRQCAEAVRAYAKRIRDDEPVPPTAG